MDVTLKAVTFKHDSNPSTSATTDGLSIRKNETQTVTVPEWSRNNGIMQGAPAAYARDKIGTNTVTIKAQFSCSDKALTKIFVQAVDGNQGCSGGGASTNVLGRVRATEVPMIKGQSDLVQMILDDVRISTAGVSVSDIIWCWQFSLDGTHWTDFATTTHKIYTVLALPTAPWKPLSPDINDTQLPWTEVLDIACDWAAGTQHPDPASDRITRRVNALGPSKVKYRYDSSYILLKSNNFDCTSFLERVRGGNGNGEYVNCYDCATAVSSFSNILGADLWQSKMGYNFLLNHLLRIGEQVEDGGDFFRHEVAWKGNATKVEAVFDACLKLDSDGKPGVDDRNFSPLLPINIIFGDPADKKYRFQIATDLTSTGPCRARPLTKRRRIIGVSKLKEARNTRTEIDILSQHYSFQEWGKTRNLEEDLLVWRFFLTGKEVSDWRSERIRCFDTIGKMPPTCQAFWTSKDGSSKVVLRVDTFECASLEDAHSFLLEVLGESHRLNFEPLSKEEEANGAVGDIAFVDPEKLAAFYARANVVVAVRNAGQYSTSVVEFARRFDFALKSRPSDDKVIEEMDHFRFPDQKFKVGEPVPIKFRAGEDVEPRLLYKFFAERGELSVQRRHVWYRPTLAGPQEVVAFGVDAEQNARVQRLTIDIAE